MIYATCTFAPEENEAVVDFLLKRYKEAKIVPIKHNLNHTQNGLLSWRGEEYDISLKDTIRILPKGAFSGFYMATIIKEF